MEDKNNCSKGCSIVVKKIGTDAPIESIVVAMQTQTAQVQTSSVLCATFVQQ